jgi:hypothetical protein
MHPFLTSEEVRERNRKICARAASEPKLTNTALGVEFGLNRETVRLILAREAFRLKRDGRIAAKFGGVFADNQAAKEKPAC